MLIANRLRPIFMTIIAALLTSISAAQQLYVGANYHPHDSNPAQWDKDIRLMKEAGFNVVRMGHLAWDSYEPADGKFTFEWFDQVMDKMDKAGIKVILDLAVRPAPLWLHRKYPSIDVVDASGNRLYPNHRYMEDVGDPAYQRYALRFAGKLAHRYARHPALLAFGIDNEPGDGPISYSETVRQRFIAWTKAKYPSLEQLNGAWAGQRWSRRISDFAEIGLPASGAVSGPPERVLDFRRFISDEVNGFIGKLTDRVNLYAPGTLTTTNMWYYSEKKYFDYAKTAYTGKITRGGNGFYPGNSLLTNWGLLHALFGISRIQFENTTPFWCTEFTTMTAVPNSIRKSAYASLFYGNQMICGWTWQSMHGGEEQYLQGMMDWDGTVNRKYDEYKQIAAEFRKIETYGFPYKPQAEVALAFSFPSQIASYSLPKKHDDQLQDCFSTFFFRNMDTRVVDVSQSSLNYKLLILPGVAVMDEVTAGRIRDYVKNGGTVIMTSGSALADEYGQVFASTLPGRLSDVFGIRIAGFEEPVNLNELSPPGLKGDQLQVLYEGKTIGTSAPRFDVIEGKGAEVLATISSLAKTYPVITSNRYGKGRAIYFGLPAKGELMNPVLDKLIAELAIKKGPDVPQDVLARYIDPTHILYLNIGKEARTIKLKGSSKSILWDKAYADEFVIQPFEPEFVEVK